MREDEHPAWATLFQAHQIPEAGFNHVLDHYQPKQSDHMPALFIDGADLQDPNCHPFYFKKLAADDPRGFILGALTHCCQSVGSAGQQCALHGMTSPDGGFYVIFKKSKPKEIKKALQLLNKAEHATSFSVFISALVDRPQRQKYRDWKETHHFNEDAALIEIRRELRTKFEAVQEGELIAQTWAWCSE